MGNLFNIIKAGGFVMYPLLLLALAAGTIIVERLLTYHKLGNLSPKLLKEVLGFCREGKFDTALQACRNEKGPVADCLGIVLANRERPSAEVERMVEETGQEYFLRLERFLPILDTGATISPLLGLLGTLVGMVGTFNAISVQQGRGNNDAILSGIGEALYATAAGITIAIICFVAYNYFASRFRTIVSQTEQAATKLLNVMAERSAHSGQ